MVIGDFTLYSVRNSVSIRLSRRSSHDSSNDVNIGSLELEFGNLEDNNNNNNPTRSMHAMTYLSAIKELADNAR